MEEISLIRKRDAKTSSCWKSLAAYLSGSDYAQGLILKAVLD